ncbi:MAG: hypothetical protein RR198_07955 [Oscillospiraceae bacterium]
MQKVEKLLKALQADQYDEVLTKQYGIENLAKQKSRFENAVTRFGRIYGFDRRANVYSVPYSVLLTGDGSDIAIPTSLDAIAICISNDVNVSRLQARDYFGEDNIDLYQKGPYEPEIDKSSGVLRGVEEAFRHFGYNVYGIDIFFDADTLPQSGLCEPVHIATTIAYILNIIFNESKITPSELSQVVQWALANYCLVDSDPLCCMASLEGKPLMGDFTNPDSPVISTLNELCDDTKFICVNTGLSTPDIAEEQIDSRLDALISKLGKSLDEMTEEEFYTAVADFGADCDKDAVLFLADYFTQENLTALYEKYAKPGIGAPVLEVTVPLNTTNIGGCSKWRNHIYRPYWMVLCCVKDSAAPAFSKAMTNLFGENSLEVLSPAIGGAKELL